MTQDGAVPELAPAAERDLSLLTVGIAILRGRRTIYQFVLGGALAGFLVAMLMPARYVSSATFLPQGSQSGTSGIALAASQLGINVPNTGGFWVSGIFVSLLKSRTLLAPLAQEPIVVAERGDTSVGFMDLFGVTASSPNVRLEKAILLLQDKIITASDDRRLGTVTVEVETPWSSVSLAIAQRLVRGVNDFNLQTRKSQASSERQFIEGRVADAERDLREAENRLQEFLLRNRVLSSSPVLAFERDRLQRDVQLNQQMYSTLVMDREDAKIREVRDTPVITIIEDPRAAARRVPRQVVRKVGLGTLVGTLIVFFVLMLRQSAQTATAEGRDDAQEFLSLWSDFVRPFGFVRRSGR